MIFENQILEIFVYFYIFLFFAFVSYFTNQILNNVNDDIFFAYLLIALKSFSSRNFAPKDQEFLTHFVQNLYRKYNAFTCIKLIIGMLLSKDIVEVTLEESARNSFELIEKAFLKAIRNKFLIMNILLVSEKNKFKIINFLRKELGEIKND